MVLGTRNLAVDISDLMGPLFKPWFIASHECLMEMGSGSLEARSKALALCYVLRVVPERHLWCGGPIHCTVLDWL